MKTAADSKPGLRRTLLALSAALLTLLGMHRH
jgi:hypothetical protein